MKNTVVIQIALFGEDAISDRHHLISDVVSSALRQAELGKWFGSGSMVTDDPNYNIEYEIVDDGQALTLIRDTLRSLSVGMSSEILLEGGRRYNVYDDNWTDLGPRQPASEVKHPIADDLAAMSSGEFLNHLKKITDDARKKYGKP